MLFQGREDQGHVVFLKPVGKEAIGDLDLEEIIRELDTARRLEPGPKALVLGLGADRLEAVSPQIRRRKSCSHVIHVMLTSYPHTR